MIITMITLMKIIIQMMMIMTRRIFSDIDNYDDDNFDNENA